MPNPSASKYRIRGLPALAEGDSLNKETPARPHHKLTSGKRMALILRSMPRPHLTDVLYHFNDLNRLSRRWPTFSYLTYRRKHVGVKTTPLHLAPYFSWAPPYDEDGLIEKILLVQSEQETQQKNIKSLMDCADRGEKPVLHECPIATAFACHFLGGSAWFRRHQERIKEIVMQTPEASFVALAAGVFSENNDPLFESIAAEPRLVLEIARSPVIRQQVQRSWFLHALERHPLYHTIWLFTTGEEGSSFRLLRQAAESDSIAAGVCLGLEPEDEQSEKWMKLAMPNPEALYWMGKVSREEHRDFRQFAHAQAVESYLAKDFRWYYHWLRDFEWDDLGFKVAALWPNPWAVELIVDYQLSKEFVIELTAKSKLDPSHPIESAVLLWASDYVQL